jgi:uncharacterized protein VirK/YbjX
MNTNRNFRSALGLMAALCSLVTLPAIAPDDTVAPQPAAPAATNPGPITDGELARFESFLDQHPNIEARLRENPDIVNNPAFQKNHPLIAQFLARHPEISAELSARPRWFIHRELVRQSATPVTRAQVAEFDRFLDQHPRLEKQLVQHPQLLRHPEFLNSNPELHEYLKRHPGIDRASESKPGRLLKREQRN